MLHRSRRLVSRASILTSTLLVAMSSSACGQAADKDKTDPNTTASGDAGDAGGKIDSSIPDEGPMPALRSGELTPVLDEAVEATVLATSFNQRGEVARYLELELPARGGWSSGGRVVLDKTADMLASVQHDNGRVLIRLRHAGDAPFASPIKGTVYLSRSESGGARTHAQPFSIIVPDELTNDAELAIRFASNFPSTSAEFTGGWRNRARHPFVAFASSRLASRLRGEGVKAGEVELTDLAGPNRPSTDLSRLMETTSSALSMQEALQHERGLRLRRGKVDQAIDLSTLVAPPLRQHPFEAMRKALKRPDAAVQEPLAQLTPADFWYLRFTDVRLLLRTLDEADAWLTPVVQILQENAEDRQISSRYNRQLALRRTDLARNFGNQVIASIAIVGSDPYLREGSDLTIIFDAKQLKVLESELGRQLDSWKAEVPGIEASKIEHGEHSVDLWRDPQGLVQRYQAVVGQRVIISNSRNAMTRLLDTADGKHPNLAAQPELQYMLARDPGTHDAFAFLSDEFIAQVIGPAQKVAQSRRQRALADLLVPGYAALLQGWIEGSEPASTADMLTQGYLRQGDLVHSDGTPIHFEPGNAAQSAWGRVAQLTPLIDLEVPSKISEQEKLAYEAFSAGYQRNWTTFIDPVAIALDIREGGKDGASTVATVQARVLPLIEASDYDDIRDVVGEQRVEVPRVSDGMQMVWAVGKDTRLRREMNQMAKSISMDGGIGLDWLGDWVAIGALDRKALLELAWRELSNIQLPEDKDEASGRERDVQLARRIGQLPVFAMADTSNPAGVAATLSALKVLANSAAPGMLSWGEHSRYREVPIVRVAASESASDPDVKAFADAISLYYANAAGVLVFALREDILHALIDRALAGGLPKGVKPNGNSTPGAELAGAQYVVTGASEPGRALWTALGWALQGQANDTQSLPRQSAEILLTGAPSTRDNPEAFATLALAYFGAVPTSASGSHAWTLTPGGVSDPQHGSATSPKYPTLPVAGSPIDSLMQRLTAIRGEVSFEEEPGQTDPPARSLHTVFELTLGPKAEL